MSSSRRKKVILKSVTVSVGCGSCRRSKLASLFFNPKPNRPSTSHHRHRPTPSSSSYSDEKAPALQTHYAAPAASPFVAVEKDSDDPYLDFRQSMLQMVLENEIYSKDDLRELLNCFLQLNSPYHHGIIIRAFTEIWNGVFVAGDGGRGRGRGRGDAVSSKPHFVGRRSRDFVRV